MTENLEEAVVTILEELQGSGACLGYKSLWRRLRQFHRLPIKRDTVLQVLHLLDPEGIEERSRYRLKRRLYCVPGPNFIWHIDGYDKLKPFGFSIHGCVDGFSRRVLWLEVSSTNKDPNVVSHFYLTTVRKLGFVPSVIRTDCGTENVGIVALQQAFRRNHEDQFAGPCSVIQGKSTANQRIESFWGRMRQHGIDYWIQIFKAMQELNILNTAEPIQVECLRYCFGPLITYDLERTLEEWNCHGIRAQKEQGVVTGKPNSMFKTLHPNE